MFAPIVDVLNALASDKESDDHVKVKLFWMLFRHMTLLFYYTQWTWCWALHMHWVKHCKEGIKILSMLYQCSINLRSNYNAQGITNGILRLMILSYFVWNMALKFLIRMISLLFVLGESLRVEFLLWQMSIIIVLMCYTWLSICKCKSLIVILLRQALICYLV